MAKGSVGFTSDRALDTTHVGPIQGWLNKKKWTPKLLSLYFINNSNCTHILYLMKSLSSFITQLSKIIYVKNDPYDYERTFLFILYPKFLKWTWKTLEPFSHYRKCSYFIYFSSLSRCLISIFKLSIFAPCLISTNVTKLIKIVDTILQFASHGKIMILLKCKLMRDSLK